MKKILAMLLAIALTATLAVPAIAVEATETVDPASHCLCGNPSDTNELNACAKGGHKVETWTKWESTNSLPTEAGYYYLADNVELTAIHKMTKQNTTVAIDLNGKTISAVKGNTDVYRLIEVGANATDGGVKLILTDSVGEGKLDYTNVTINTGENVALGIFVRYGNLDIYGGTITSSRTSHCYNGGEGLCVRYGTKSVVNMYGGAFVGGQADATAGYGGNVWIRSGTFNMYGGVIAGGYAYQGGNVSLNYLSGDKPTFNMYGGIISGGSAKDMGGCVALATANTKFTMNGGTIDARGKTAGHGAAIAGNGNGAEIIINDGLIYGGTSTGSGGSAISGIYGVKVTINGGAIVGGTHKSTTRDRVGDGGTAARIFDSTFTMTGGTITGGTIDSSMQNASGSVMITGSSTATISGNSVITGGTGADGKASNLWLNGKTVAIGEGGLGEKANIGVTMATPGAFVTTGATAQNLAYFSADAEGYYTIKDGDSLKLTNEIGTNTALIGDSLYATVKDAAAAANGKTVTLVTDVETAEVAVDATLNLNGKTLKTLNIANGKTVTLADTSTDDYETAGKMVKVTGEGTVKSDAVVDGKRYVAIKETVEEETYYSAHRIYLAVTSSVLSNGCSAMNFKTVLKCNQYVARRIEGYGVTVNGNFVAYENAELVAGGDWNQKTTKLTGFLKGDAGDAEWAATDVQVSATIKLGDTVINSAVKTRSLKTMVETVAQGWAGLDADQQGTLKTLYATYGESAGMDSWNIPAEMKAN